MRGRLLISKPVLHDPNFDGTITLLLEHGPEGALGLILNRPSQLTIADAFPLWASASAEPGVVFSGGPVERNAMIVLGTSSTEAGPLSLGMHSIDLDEGSPPRADGVDRIRVFAGYAGWGVSQLESELAQDAWWTAEATPDDVFCPHPEELWPSILRREGGEMEWFAHYPEDPSTN